MTHMNIFINNIKDIHCGAKPIINHQKTAIFNIKTTEF